MLTRIEKDVLRELIPLLCENSNFLSASALPYDMVTTGSPCGSDVCYEVNGALTLRLSSDGIADSPAFECDTTKAIETFFFEQSEMMQQIPGVVAAGFNRSPDSSVVDACDGIASSDRATVADAIEAAGPLEDSGEYIGAAVAGLVLLIGAAVIGRRVRQYNSSNTNNTFNAGSTPYHGGDIRSRATRIGSDDGNRSWRRVKEAVTAILIPATFRLQPEPSTSTQKRMDGPPASTLDREEEEKEELRSSEGQEVVKIVPSPSDPEGMRMSRVHSVPIENDEGCKASDLDAVNLRDNDGDGPSLVARSSVPRIEKRSSNNEPSSGPKQGEDSTNINPLLKRYWSPSHMTV